VTNRVGRNIDKGSKIKDYLQDLAKAEHRPRDYSCILRNTA